MFLALFSGTLLALTAEDAAKFYLKSGETFKTDTIKIGATTYYLLKINDKPSIVLGPTDLGYLALNDSAVLDPVLDAYAQKVFDGRDWKKSLTTVNNSGAFVSTYVRDCVVGGQTFLKAIPGRVIKIGKAVLGLYFLISRSKDGLYKTEYNAIQSFNASFPDFENAYLTFNTTTPKLTAAVEAKNVPEAFKAAGEIRTASSTLKKKYTEITSAYASLLSSKELSAILQYTFYDQGDKHNCTFNTNVTAALTSLESEFLDPVLTEKASLKETILTQTSDRQGSALSQTAHAVRSESYVELAKSIQDVTRLYTNFSSPLTLTALVKMQGQLDADLKQLKSGNQTDKAGSDYDQVSEKIESDLTQYKAVAAEFKSASSAVALADANFTAALRRYGEADTRMVAYKTELDQIKGNFTANTLALQSGDFAKVRFANVTETARDFAFTLSSLKPKESEIDPLIIAAVVVLLLGLGGTVFYFRKMKPPSAPPQTPQK